MPLLELDDLEPVPTGDGSTTWRQKGRGITYRSHYGAHTEARHIYLEGTGLIRRPGPWSVLELGLGVATNFQLTAHQALQQGLPLRYTAVEARPIPAQLLQGQDIPSQMARQVLEALRAGATLATERRGELTLTVHRALWLQAPLGELAVDAVYYDPFSPRDDPQSWCEQSFAVAARCMAPHAVLGTYSVAKRVRRAMRAAGLHVASAPGPGRKWEITFAALSPEPLASYRLLGSG